MASSVTLREPQDKIKGILTKTVIESPVVRWILHARIRERRLNDVVFVGDDFIHVKQVKEHGHLQHIATKRDFDARIRAARTFTNDHNESDEDHLVKSEDDEAVTGDSTAPPHFLVLTLDSNDMLFLYLRSDGARGYSFAHQTCPMPTFDRILFQPGEHLAVDPQSRALAVAANEREVVIYSVKPEGQIRRQLQVGDRNWCPVSAQRPMQVDGVIQQMDFLGPPSDDEDHIVLALIVTDQRRTQAIWIDWYHTSDLHHAQIHPAHALCSVRSVSSLLIPLRDAAFLLIHGSEVVRWKNILSGSATEKHLGPIDNKPSDPGASPRRPVWANWCRPRRGAVPPDTDHLYLVREDGSVFLMQATGEDVQWSNAGDFECHVGTAFASLGDDRDPDILAVAGDMSSGGVYTIGTWSTPIRIDTLSRADTMRMGLVETIPNWASVTDMVTSTLPGKLQRPRDGVFVTSCRQPYGSITELRQGLEARLSVYFELEGLRSVTDLWALPLAGVGHVLLAISTPSGTLLLTAPANFGSEGVEEVDETRLALDAAHRTLAAAATPSGLLIQVTDASICITTGVSANFEDCARVDCSEGSIILAAAIETVQSIALTAERSNDKYSLLCYIIHSSDAATSGDAQVEPGAALEVDYEPLCLEIVSHTSGNVALVATVEGELDAYAIRDDGTIWHLARRQLPPLLDGHSICDNVAILRSSNNENQPDPKYLAVCGLRDGRLYNVTLNVDGEFQFAEDAVINFSQSKVKLTQPLDDRSAAYAMSGTDTCLLTWDGSSASSLTIQNIWISDKSRPQLAQGLVVACTHMPAAHLLETPDLADSLIMISGDEFLITTLDRMPASVPRQIRVAGTPNRILYATQQRCLVCASWKYGVRTFPSDSTHAKPEVRRQLWPVIDFVPSRSSEPSFSYSMQPGQRVYALLEWSFKLSEDKVYSFVLVGGSYAKPSKVERGRINFLQPVIKDWKVVDVQEGKMMSFDAPVYAMALLDDITFVACVGQNVLVCRFSVRERKWAQICAPCKLASAGINVTVSPLLIYVSTAEDSLVVLELQKNQSRTDEEAADEHEWRLVLDCAAVRADTLLTHVAPVMRQNNGREIKGNMALTSTKFGNVIGLGMHNQDEHSNAAELLFEAQLPRCLTRIRQCNIRPRWKADPPKGVIVDNVLGCTANGTIVGIALLDEQFWRRLSWLHRLCEWSEELSPHSHQSPAYIMDGKGYASEERVMPIGFAEASRGEIVMRTSLPRLRDAHLDGDVLARLLEKGSGAERLAGMVREVTRRNDRAGEWMRVHLEEELEAVDEIVTNLRKVLDIWL